MYSKVQIKSVPVKDDSICTELSLPYFITREQRRELTDDIDGNHTVLVIPHLTGKLYDINMSLVTQRMSSQRRKSLHEYYSFLCDLHHLCVDNAGLIYVV
jgi:hypothetical protein